MSTFPLFPPNSALQKPTAGQVPVIRGSPQFPESTLPMPWNADPASSWLDYRCWVEVELDPGTALHKILPQEDADVDTLGVVDCQSPFLDKFTSPNGGVNVQSYSQAEDVIQRMATSTYLFVLRGYGLRAGFQVPVPVLAQVGPVTPVPTWPQRTSGNVIVGNFSGIPIFYCTWELRYIVAVSPSGSQTRAPVPYDPALHIRPDAQLPTNGLIPAPTAVIDSAVTDNTGTAWGYIQTTAPELIKVTGLK